MLNQDMSEVKIWMKDVNGRSYSVEGQPMSATITSTDGFVEVEMAIKPQRKEMLPMHKLPKYDMEVLLPQIVHSFYLSENKSNKHNLIMAGKVFFQYLSTEMGLTYCNMFWQPVGMKRHAYLVCSGIAICNPVDNFDLKVGATEAFRKAMNQFANQLEGGGEDESKIQSTVEYFWKEFLSFRSSVI